MKITEQIYIVGSLQLGISGKWDSHVYIVKGPEGLVMIDAGGGGSGHLILDNVRRDGLDPADIKALLLTHNHFDHSCGAAEIREATGCAVFLSAKSKEMLERGTAAEAGLDLAIEQGVYPTDFRYRNCVVDHAVEDSDEISAAGLEFRAIGVNGHSPDSVCYLVEIEGKRNLFAGDVLFYGGVIGLINAPGSGMDGYRKELKKLSGLNIDGLFPGHMLFTIRDGQTHIDAAIEKCGKGGIPQTIGNCGVVF